MVALALSLSKHTYATQERGRSASVSTRQAVWHSLRPVADANIADNIYRINTDEVETG